MLQQLTEIKGIVMATGGGAILREENRKLLSENGFVIYLHCDVDKLLERTRRDSQRPLLNTQDPKERLETLFEQRKPLYTSIADFTIDTGILQSKDVVTQILDVYDSIQN